MKNLLTLVFLFLTALTAHAEATIKIISSFPVGSGPDVLARAVANQMSQNLKAPVIVVNRPGGNGAVAMSDAVSDTDVNNIILYASNDNLVVYPLMSNDYKLINNFTPLKEALWSDLVLATGPAINNINDIFQAKQLNYGSWGVGSAPHLMGSQFSNKYSGPVVHIPYRDYSAWFSDLSSGRLLFSFVSIASTEHLQKAGKLKYHAIAGASRNERYPSLPTLQESGIDIQQLVGWAGFYVPKNMSADRSRFLKQALDNAYQSNEVKNTAKTLNYNIRNLSVNEFASGIQQEQEKYRQFFKSNNISAN
jgi:tripartite-type tricarboxylate transporter receptor subunit TctC